MPPPVRQWVDNVDRSKMSDNNFLSRSTSSRSTTSYNDVYERDALEKKFGVYVLMSHAAGDENDGNERLGYAFNIRPVMEKVIPIDSDKPEKRSGVSIYFVDVYGETFRTTVYFAPYFYIKLSSEIAGVNTSDWDHRRYQVIQLLESLAIDKCREKVDITLSQKIDLSEIGHIQQDPFEVYKLRDFIRLTFLNIEDCKSLRRELESRLGKNKKEIILLTETAQQTIGNGGQTNQVSSSTIREVHMRLDEEPLLLAESLLESDLPLVSRVCIDLGIRCGKWYNVTSRHGQNTQINCCNEDQQSELPPLRYLAWDIEVTKDRLKFPNPHKDSITLISYMCDSHGFLIVNRSFLSEDIDHFDYSPSVEYPGRFKIFNVPDEKAVIIKFFEHIRELKPHIHVTFNGDNFDFEFVRIRCKILGLSLFKEIGFPYSTSDGVPPIEVGFPTAVKTAMGDKQEYQGRFHLHIDCLRWVERDSYLPCGSRGLKSVTRYKLGYNPRELDPELMMKYAAEKPRLLAEYSVSDAVATYYLYQKYIHSFTFALASIIPLAPDDILRKGSGTLCEHLLMAEAFKGNIIFPSKHIEVLEKWKGDNLLVTETYVGGSVAQLQSGIFRSDLPETFSLNSYTYKHLIETVDKTIEHWFIHEDGKDIPKEQVENYTEIKNDIVTALMNYRDCPIITEEPLIYHFDVGAMYPNIILSNRLQPTSIVSEEQNCKHCAFYTEKSSCQKPMGWQWKGEQFPLSRGQIEFVKDQLIHEQFSVTASNDTSSTIKSKRQIPKEQESSNDSDDSNDAEMTVAPTPKEEKMKSWKELTEKQKHEKLFERLKLISRKQSRKFKVSVEEHRTDIVCMRENPFYVQTVRDFRDRRYIFKVKKKEAEQRLHGATDEESRLRLNGQVILYDSLQLAHKCILNSFYGYVMRKGSRWYSLQMAAIVTYTGAQIIRSAYNLAKDIGKPLELDTDGIWTLLPKRFPQDFKFRYKTSSGVTKSKMFNYPCTLLNLEVYKTWANEKYLEWDSLSHSFVQSVENSVLFEVDGPYKAMILPASEKEGMTLKKRYAVFDMKNKLVELKGFEIKRRGELQLLKIFQEEVFPKFLEGSTKSEAFGAVAEIANRWLDFLDTRGQAADNISEVFELIAESKCLSKPVKSQESYKSMGITTARRLTELLGDPTYINDKGVKCEYVVCSNDELEKTLRAVPIQLFDAPSDIQEIHLQRWLGISKSMASDPRLCLDWAYYRQRLITAVLKIIVIPALFQGLNNPVPRVIPPDWIRKAASDGRSNQTRLTSFFLTETQNTTVIDVENIVVDKIHTNRHLDGHSKNSIIFEEPYEANHVHSKINLLNKGIQNDILPLCDESSTLHMITESIDNPLECTVISDWLVNQQKEWKLIRDKLRRTKKKEKELESTFNHLTGMTTSIGIASHIKIPKEIFERKGSGKEFIEWTLVDIEEDFDEEGLLYFYAILSHLPFKIYRIPVQHMRRVFVNCRTSFELNIPGIRIRELNRKIKYTLPRRLKPYRLFELSMPETLFKQAKESLRPSNDIISVYGLSSPLDFDVLRCYGNSVRLNANDSSININILPNCGEVIQGPSSFETVERPATGIPITLQWLYVFIAHEGSIEQPDRIMICLFQPPLYTIDSNKEMHYTTSGSTAMFVGGGTANFHSAAKSCNQSQLFQRLIEQMTEGLPSFFHDTLQCKELLKGWSFTPTQLCATPSSALMRLHACIQKLIISAETLHRPALAVYLLSSIPGVTIGAWADPRKRNTIQGEQRFVLFHANADIANSTPIPKFSKFDFVADVFQFSIREFISGVYLTEWSSIVSEATQIPLIQTMKWSRPSFDLQKTILDLMLSRGLEANHMISWESQSLLPDLGTNALITQASTDYEALDEDVSQCVTTPGIHWTIAFRIGFGTQLTLEALTHIDYLSERFSDPIRHEFSRSHTHTKKKSNFGTTSDMSSKTIHNNPIRLDDTIELNDMIIKSHETNDSCVLDTTELEEYFQHNSCIPPKVLVVLQFCIRHLRHRFELCRDSLSSMTLTTGTSALKFLWNILGAIKSWIESRNSLLYDPSLHRVSNYWTARYMQAFSQDIKRVSEDCVESLLVSPFMVLLATPTLSQRQGTHCLKLLFSSLKTIPLYQHLHPERCEPYRGLILMDASNWFGLKLNPRPHWENKLQLLEFLPAPISSFILKSIEYMISEPFKKAGLQPDTDPDSEDTLLSMIEAAAKEHVLDESILITKWLDYIDNFETIKEDWLKSGKIKVWEEALRYDIQRQIHAIELRKNIKHLIDKNELLALKRELHSLYSSLKLNHESFLEQKCWEVPKRPGMLRIELCDNGDITDTQVLYNRLGRPVKIVSTIDNNQLQLELTRILYYCLTLNHNYWKLNQDQRENLLTRFCESLRVSSYAETLEFKQLYGSLYLQDLICNHCNMSFSLNIISMLKQHQFSELPEWHCPSCDEHLAYTKIEFAFIKSIDDALEAAQVQDLICTKCKRVKSTQAIKYCSCGGSYRLRIPEIEFQLFFRIGKSLVDTYPNIFPWALEHLQQLQKLGIMS